MQRASQQKWLLEGNRSPAVSDRFSSGVKILPENPTNPAHRALLLPLKAIYKRQLMNANTRCITHSSLFVIAAIIAVVALAGVNFVQASPDPAVYVTNGIALFQGNQSNGIAGGVGKDFLVDQVTTLNVNSLTGSIHPSDAVSGINFQKTGAGDVTINAGLSGSNIVINTTGAAGIFAGSVGSPPANPSPDPFWGIPIPTNSSAQGGVVQVQSYSDITNRGDNVAGILATSQTTGYAPTIIRGLTNLANAGVTFTVIGVTNADGTNVAVGVPATGTLVDTTGTNILGTGGTFTISSTGTFSFDAGTNLSGLAVSESFQSIVNYTVQGVNKTGMTNDSLGTLSAIITMTTNGLVTNCEASFATYGTSTNQNSALPDLGSYGQYLVGTASAGGAGNSVTVDNEGTIKTYGTNSSGIFAQSIGGNGGTGGDGSISHSAGGGGTGSNGGAVTVTANGSITTISNNSCGVVAWSQGGTGGQGGYGGAWRYGGPGGTSGNGGKVYVTGNGDITTYGDHASGILAVSAGGNGGGGGGSWKVVTGGGNGGNGGQGGAVTVDGDWNITTFGDYSYGIWAKSVGGNAGTGGSGGWIAGHPGNGGQATDGGTVTVNSGGTIETSGDNSYGIYAESIGGFGGHGGSQTGIFYSEGGSGESAGSGGDVNVTQEASGQIITHGTNSHGIFAQSVGGGGGSGGSGGALVGYGGGSANGGFGRNVNVTNYGAITTYGSGSKGIYAQSVGGGGGDGGFGAGAGAVGGKGSGTSDGGEVNVVNAGTIDSQAEAIFAQSIGGGGGNGGSSSGWFSFGGSGGGGGNADSVTVVNTGNLTNHEDNASAIFAQSLGGGGGNGGCSGSVGAFGSLAVGGSGAAGGSGADVSVYSGTNSIDTGGDSSHGIFAQSVGGGGGNGGYAVAASIGKGASVSVAVGGNAGAGGSASNVVVDSSSTITTRGTGSHGIFAQSVGGGGGTGGFSLALSGSDGLALALGIGGCGGGGGNSQEVTVNNSGQIETFGDRSYGILAQSVGGGGGDGGFSISVAGSLGGLALPLSFGGSAGTGGAGSQVFLTNSATIITCGNDAHGIMAQSVGGGGGSGGFSIAGAISTGNALSLSFGGSGGSGGAASNVTALNSGNIATLGDRSYGVLAQSVGGGGGDGGFSVSGGLTAGSSVGFSMGGNGSGGGAGGNVYLESSGSVFTAGDDSHALFAQSVGGGGGSGGFSVAGGISQSPTVQIGIGGKGGSGSNGGDVTLISDGPTNHTEGDRAYGIFAQSVGGGGGDGGFGVAGGITKEAAVSFAMGGNGSTGGTGGLVFVSNTSRIETAGDLAHGILAQSIGGGGGAGGFSMAGSLALSQESKQISVSIGGDGGGGGSGSNVMVFNSGSIVTLGEHANGIFAQSVGGGGGDGGEAKVMNKSLGMAFTNSGSAGSNDNGWSLSIAIGAGGNGGSAGNGGVVMVTNLGSIYTGGSNSIGIMAQSVGGGGGSGGLSATDASGGGGKTSVKLNFGLGGAGGGGGAGNIVTVVNQGAITTVGDASHGIFAQSVGGGGGLGGASTSTTSSPDSDTSHSVTLTAVIGGSGGAGGNGSNVMVMQEGNITTYGEGAYGILAQSVGGGGGAGGTAKIETEKDTNSLSLPSLTATPASNSSSSSDDKAWGVDISFGLGGKGGVAGDGGRVTVDNHGDITTYGNNSIAIFAQSVGGGGGAGGMSQIEGRGDSGNTNLSLSISLGAGLGGAGGAGGAGNTVAVTNQGTIITVGDAAHGIFAQSVGGGGGVGGASSITKSSPGSGNSISLNAVIGGGAGIGGNGSDVMVLQEGSITTYGEGADGIFAQSVGGGGGMGGTAKIETQSDTNSSSSSSDSSTNSSGKEWSVDLSFGMGGSGGGGGGGGQVMVVNRGSITNYGNNSIGIFAQSVGGGGGAGGMSEIDGVGSSGNTNLSLSVSLGGSVGGGGGGGGAANTVTVTNQGTIITGGDAAHGIFAQSVGGGGGLGGASAVSKSTPESGSSVTLTAAIGGSGGLGGNGSNVMVIQEGTITTYGEGAYGILAQSVGGGGGMGGTAKIEMQQDTNSSSPSALAMAAASDSSTNNASTNSTDKEWSIDLSFGLGGSGGIAGNGGQVTVDNHGSITNYGANSIGIFAQSVGGGGGAGGASQIANAANGASTNLSLSINLGGGLGGKGGAGGSGDTVRVTNEGSITTYGDAGYGIVAQSIGGGGGNGGASAATTASAGDKSINLTATIGGGGGAAGDGGAVTVDNQGQINTWGNGAYGILAQSVGGGGGNGGTAKIETQEANTNSASSSASEGSDTNAPTWSINLGVGVGGGGGSGGNGGAVSVNNAGNITTRGANALGIFAQSVGGGGGSGGMSSVDNGGSDANIAIKLGVSLGGSGPNGGFGSTVTVANTGTIITYGDSSHAIMAQSVGGGGGLGGDSATTSTAGTNTQRSVNLSLSLGGSGSLGGNAGAVNVYQTGQIYTVGANAYGILAQSVGGGGGAGGTSVSTPGGTGNLLQLAIGIGGKGGPGGYAGAVNVVSSGGITTYGDGSYAIIAQSIGGGGGVGADTVTAAGSGSTLDLTAGIGGAGGNGNYGGAVTVTNTGDIYTYGNNALGILAQSIGGGGGRGGSATAQSNLTGDGNTLDLNVSVGGNGAGASDGGAVTVDNNGNIVTFGVASHGIMAQSIGGGGGDGGYGGAGASASGLSDTDLQIVVGGKGGSSGNGSGVTVQNSGYIVTFGAGAFGVLAQSVGGGGGIGGYGQSGALANLALGGGGGSGGNGGDVNVNVTGGIETFGDGAYGVFAQSVGGGGGVAGNVNHGVSAAGLAVNLGQSGGGGGNGGDVTIVSDGEIITHGTGACGIFAQSVGGGGGLAGDLGNGLSFAGSVGGAGSAGDIHIIHTGDITTYGDYADGIFAQSAGGTNTGGSVEIDYIGSINVYGANASAVFVQSRGDQGADNLTLTIHNGVFAGGSGASAGVWFADGGNNTLYNFNTITTLNGIAGNAIIGGTGNETINNDGTIIGSVDLGSGLNQFNNYSGGQLDAGAVINLGAGNRFLSNGILAPGGPGVLETTALTGNFLQFSNGVLEIELGSTSSYDRLAVSGTAELAGTLSVALFGGFVPVKGDQFTVLTAADGVTGEFTNLDDPLKGNYALHLGTLYAPNQVNLITLQDSFVPFALTHNQRVVARDLDTFSGYFSTNQLQGDPRETNLIAALDAVPGTQLPADFDLIAPEELGALFDMNFGAVDSMVGNVQRRMNEIRNGSTLVHGRLFPFEPGGPVAQLAYADQGLPPMGKGGLDEEWGGFATGFGQFVDVNSDGNAAGYSYHDAGLTLGLDKSANHCLAGGFTVDYANGGASLVNGGSASMEGLRGGFYGSWFSTNAYLEAQLGMGTYRYNSERVALDGTAKGKTAGYEVDTMLGGGYNLRYKDFIPGILGELHYTHVEINGFTESGSALPLQVMENESDSLWTLLGTRLAYELRIAKTTLLPEIRLGWRHEFLDANQTIGARMASGAGGVFEVEGPSLGRDSLSLVVGMSTHCSQNVSIGVYYDGELASDSSSSHAVSGGINWDF